MEVMKQLFSYLVFKLQKQMGMEKIDFRVEGVNLIKEKHGYENEFQSESCLRYWPFETILLTFHVLILKLHSLMS